MDIETIKGWAKDKAKQIVISILGLVAMLGYWSFCGTSKVPGHTTDEGKIPSVIWEGGNNKLSIEADTTTPATMRVSFQAPAEGDKDYEERYHEAWEKIEPGHHSYTVAFPETTDFSTVELGADNPKVGDELSWVVKLNDEVVQEDSYTLEKPLDEGYAMFLQVELEQWLQGNAGDAEVADEHGDEE
jgi:hypothetical protein